MRGNALVAQLAARSAQRRTGRLATTVLAVALATSFSVAAFGVAAQMERLVAGTGDATDAVATLPEGSVVVTSADSGATEPTAISAALIERAASVEGVLTAGGTYEQPIAVRIERGSQDDRPPAFRGLVFTSEWDPERWSVIDGRPPTTGAPVDGAAADGTASEDRLPVALNPGGLLSAGAQIGDRIELQTPTGGVDAVVVALVAPVTAVGGAGYGQVSEDSADTTGIDDANIVIDGSALPDLLGARGRVDRITVTPRPGVSTDELIERLRPALPDGLRVASAADPQVLQARAVSAISGGIVAATWGFAVLSALVAALLVSNTFAIVVSQRNAELALTRCLGLTRGQATTTFLIEAALIGVVAAAAGLAAGVPLSMLATTVLQPDADVQAVLTRSMVLAALVIGLGVTVIAAVVPAVRAGRVAPVEALQAATARRRRRGPLLVVLVPLLTAVRALGRRSRTLRMAVATPLQDPRRAGATISTLCIGLALMSMVLTLGASVRSAIDDQFVDRSSASVVIRRRGVVRVDAAALERRLGLPDRRIGLVDVTSVEGTIIGPNGAEPTVSSSRLDGSTEIVDPEVVEGSGVLDGGAMLSVPTAERLGVGVGDQVTLRSTSGDEIPVEVLGLYRSTSFLGPAVVDRDVARAIDAEGTFELAALTLPAGAPVERIIPRIDRRLSGFNRLGVDTPEGFAAVDTDIADTVTRLALVLLSGSVLLGGLGAANNVSLSVLERRREFALLRAVGASRHQVRTLVSVESMLLCSIAGASGAVIGTALGVVGVSLAPAEFAATARVPWVSIGVIVVGAVVLGAVAAAVPARAAVRRELLEDLDAP